MEATAIASNSQGGGDEAHAQNIKNFAQDALVEGKKEFAKRIVQGAFGLAVLLTTFVLALVSAAYFLLLEPRIARHIASIITAEGHFTTDDPKAGKIYANPIDDYVLKVFLMEIAKDKGSSSEYAGKIIDAVNKGKIREGFQIFSKSIGKEIDTLEQIKNLYQQPTTVQFGDVYFEVSSRPQYSPKIFSVLVSRGQLLELFATDIKIDILQDNNQEIIPGFQPIDLMLKCTGCKTWRIDINNVRNATDFGRLDLTEKIDWPSGDGTANKLKHLQLEVVPNVGANIKYRFGARFVVLVQNTLPQTRASQ